MNTLNINIGPTGTTIKPTVYRFLAQKLYTGLMKCFPSATVLIATPGCPGGAATLCTERAVSWQRASTWPGGTNGIAPEIRRLSMMAAHYSTKHNIKSHA
jgi:hypothetical protein